MNELALNGGRQACPPGTIPAWPAYGQEELTAVQRVVESRKWWRGTGSEVEQFEREFAEFHGCRFALAVSNGTQALEIALSCLGIGFGDEVIVPAFTFVATATAVLTVGAIPVTVDVDLDTYCINVAAARRAITPRTKAIIPVHLAGHPADMDGLLAIARDTGVLIVSDSAHAHGAQWKGISLPKLTPASMYSFQNLKLLAAGEGGALLTDDEEIARRAWLKHTYGRPNRDTKYQHLELGTNCRMTEFQGAVLRPQLVRFPQLLLEREEGSQRLDQYLSGIDGLHLPTRHPSVSTHAHYMYMLRVEPEKIGLDRDFLVQALVAEGVPAYRTYPCIPDLEMFERSSLWNGELPPALEAQKIRQALQRHTVPNSREISRNAIWLHHAVLLGGEQVQSKVAEAFHKVLAHREVAAAV
ncbi:MAG TPA: DegT/DnrJ/EryC1/StrS family aminotransferase [Candidatus Angelobacter sp.]|nr:DegT/DnrJ/EryC1/StrS family aminotransferase [Candidatus Angelobacter sp.]